MIKHTLIVTITTILLVWLMVALSGCQWDTQANNSIRFLMDGEGPESRQSWAFGDLK